MGELKSAQTLTAMFAVCFALVTPFVIPALEGVAGGLAATADAARMTLADDTKSVIVGYIIDDNLSIPPVAYTAIAVTLWLLT